MPEATLEIQTYSAAVIVADKRYAAAWGPLVDSREWVVAGGGHQPHRVANRDAALAELTTIRDAIQAADVAPTPDTT